MEYYTKYKEDTGEIEYTFEGSLEDANLNQPFLIGLFPSDKYTVVDGVAVERLQSDIDQDKMTIALGELTQTRNNILLSCDWTQGLDAPLSDAQKQSWRVYRQALRDLPATTEDPENPVWPIPPS